LARTVPVQVGWAARIASASGDAGYGIATDTLGNVVVTGNYNAEVTIFNQGSSGTAGTTLPYIGGSDCFIAKYSTDGAVLWAARIAGTTTSSDIGTGIATDTSGNVVVAGYYGAALTVYNQGPSGTAGTTLPFTGGIDVFVAKYSSAGAVLWAARIAGTGTDIGFGIATDLSGNVVVTGYYNAALTIYNQGPSGTAGTTLTNNGNDVFIAKYSSAGAVLWAARISGTGTDVGNGIATDPSGNVVVAGYYSAALTIFNQGPSGTAGTTLPYVGGQDCFVAKYSSAGAVLWAARIAGTSATSGDGGNAIATDSSGNVVVTGYYFSAAVTIYNQGPTGTAVTTLPFTGDNDCFVAKYSSAGAVLWAARIASTGAVTDIGRGISTDLSGNVLVTGGYGGALTIYNQGSSGTAGTTLSNAGGQDCFVAKYSSAGAVLWAARIASTNSDVGRAIATDPSGNVLVTGDYGAALTVYNQGPSGTAGTTLSNAGFDVFIVKYTPDGLITNAATSASSNVLVSATYTPSTFSPFVNGFTQNTLAGTTLTTTGLFLGGPSNYFNGTISEVLIFGTTLSAAQRQSVEGYLSRKWGIGNRLITTHPFYTIPPFNRYFNPTDIPGCSLWLDGADGSSMNLGVVGVTTLAGNAASGFADGTGVAARFESPNGIARLLDGNLVVADGTNNRIRVVTPAGTVTTLAGSGTGTFADGTGAAASFNFPYGIAVLSDGNIVVADRGNNRIRIVTPGGVVTTLAGSGTEGSTDATGISAQFKAPSGVAVLSDGKIAVADSFNSVIRIVTYPGGVVTSLAGLATGHGYTDATGTSAQFFIPHGVAQLLDGSIVVTDTYNSRIRRVTYPGGAVTTLAGSGSGTFADGTGTAASFSYPVGVAVIPSSGSIVVADQYFGRVRLITYPGGVVTTLAGSGVAGSSDGPLLSARLGYPRGITLLPNGNIVLAEESIRLITLSSTWSDKSGLNNTMTGTATWTGTTMSFNGTNQAFSNTAYVFPASNYSMFGVYSNTTAPAAGAYMNAVYGSNGFPMLGTFGTARDVTARSVVANTGALGVPVGWAARIAGTTTSSDIGLGIAADLSGNVFVVGYYTAAVTLFNTGGTTGATLPITGAQSVFVAKYTSAGTVTWAAQIGATSGVTITGIITDSSGNAIATGTYYSAVTLYNTGGAVGATLAFTGGGDVFIAKYSSAGSVLWATRITGTSTSSDSGQGIAADPSGNVFVIGYYSAAVTLFNTGGTTGATLPFAGSSDTYVAKYSSAGTVLWAAQIASTTGSDIGFGIAADLSGNVFVIGYYGAALTLYNTSGTSGATLPFTGGLDVFVAKYSSAGAVLWAAQITGTTTSSSDQGKAIATDSSGNVFITGEYAAALALYNTNGTTGATLPNAGTRDCFIAKYSSGGAVLWAARITSTGIDIGNGIATDSSGNVLVTGYCSAATTLYNTGGTIGATLAAPTQNQCFIAKYSSVGAVTWAARAGGTNGIGTGITVDPSGNVLVTGYYAGGMTLYDSSGVSNATLPFTGSVDAFLAKYSPNGYIIGQFPASSNVLVSATYTPSTFSPFINGTATSTTLAGTTLATTGIFVGGPSNYFNGTISELLIYASTLTAAQRQQVEGYLIDKWQLRAQTLSNHQYKLIPPATPQPPQFAEVTPGNWVRDWQPELRSLIATNNPTNATVIPTVTYGTGGPALSPTIRSQSWFGGVLAPSGNIYCIPNGSSNILIINPTTNAVSYGTNSLSPALSTQPYSGGVLGPNGNIYCAPAGSSNILIINPTTNTVSYGTSSLSPALSTQYYVGGVLAPSGNIYCIPNGSSNILIINPTTNTVSYGTGGPALTPALSTQTYWGGVLAPNGNIYCAPRGSSNILIINPTTNTVSYGTGGPALSPALSTQYYNGGVLAPNGNIYFTPDSTSNILILNPTTNAVSYGTGGPALTPALSTQTYSGGVLAPNGNIYCVSYNSSNILIINPTTNAVSYGTGGPALSPALSTVAYNGGVLAPNGNIYCVPFLASNVLIINNTYTQLPSSNYVLSAYANKF
jgi:hypothetical protein